MTPPTAPLRALLQFRKGEASQVGPERFRLLAAIQRHGSISAAARDVGLSYRGAWDAVQALNNLFERPLVAAQAGGRTGGAASVTEAGAAALIAYAQVETALASAAEQLDKALAGADVDVRSLIWSLGMKTSARNALRGVISTVTPGAVNAEVLLDLAEGLQIVSIITRESVADLDLKPGREAMALIKSSFVILAAGEQPIRTSARNQFTGTVIRHEVGAVNDEVVLDIGVGKTITVTITRESAESLELKIGERAQALIKASHVILAVD